MGKGGSKKGKEDEGKRGYEQVNEQLKEAVKVMVKGVSIMQKLEGMGLEEKRKMKRVDETVEQYVARIEEANVMAVEAAIKRIVEE